AHLGVPERRAGVLQREQLAGLGRVTVPQPVRVPVVRLPPRPNLGLLLLAQPRPPLRPRFVFFLPQRCRRRECLLGGHTNGVRDRVRVVSVGGQFLRLGLPAVLLRRGHPALTVIPHVGEAFLPRGGRGEDRGIGVDHPTRQERGEYGAGVRSQR